MSESDESDMPFEIHGLSPEPPADPPPMPHPSLLDMSFPVPARSAKPLINAAEARKLWNCLHPIQNAERLKKGYYMPLYTAVHQAKRWCGNPCCFATPKPTDPVCPLCRTLFCCADHLDAIHQRKEGETLIRNSWCGVVDQTSAVREYLRRVFLEFKRVETRGGAVQVFKESETVRMLEYWFWHCVMLGGTWREVSPLKESDFLDTVRHEPLFRFVDAMVWEVSQSGFANRPKPTSDETTLIPGNENVFQDFAGLYVLCCFAQELICSTPGKSQALLNVAALVHATREDFALGLVPKDPAAPYPGRFVGISLSKDAMRAEFFAGEKAAPLALFNSDEQLHWPARYYVVHLVPLGLTGDLRRRFLFSIGLYVCPKDSMILCSVGEEKTGFGFTSMLPEIKTNPFIDRSSFVADTHVSHQNTKRWFTRVAELTDPETTPDHREQVLRLLTAAGKNIPFPADVPVFRLVTCRVVMNIV